MYAIIEDGGRQIKVSQGDVIKVDLKELAADAATVTFDRVLLVGGVEGVEPRLGLPLLSGAKVTADVIGEEKTDKVPIVKFRRRKNYRRKKGHRQPYLKVKITAIEA